MSDAQIVLPDAQEKTIPALLRHILLAFSPAAGKHLDQSNVIIAEALHR